MFGNAGLLLALCLGASAVLLVTGLALIATNGHRTHRQGPH